MNKKYIITILVLLILGLFAGGYYLLQNKKIEPPVEEAVNSVVPVEDIQKTVESINEKATQGVLPDIHTEVNPIENVPDANPYSETNPFSDVKVNPFE